MKNHFLWNNGILLLICFFTLPTYAQPTIQRISAETLMNEVRATPYPLNGGYAKTNPPRLRWPDKFPHLGPVLDGVEETEHKPRVTYKVRLARDKEFTKDKIEAIRNWAFYNPSRPLEAGKWYWQQAYVAPDGKEEWSAVYHFTVDERALPFHPPSYKELADRFSQHHPRVLLDKNEWDEIIRRNIGNPEAEAYLTRANRCLTRTLLPLHQEIDTTGLAALKNDIQRKALLIRESRKIVDREEVYTEAMVRAYLLTKDEIYYRETMKRLTEVISWQDSPYFAGDFNLSTLLSMSTSAYDAFFDLLNTGEKELLLTTIRRNGAIFFEEFVNHLENRIADNHVWQMTLRILTMAAFATLNEIPEADIWADYCYNMWVNRFPGLTNDGAWHNGDSYFHVNIRTLIEVPAFYSRVTGFDFFNDPWYNNNALYVIYHQLPFSKSAGHGNSHETKFTPNGARIGYADALARECENPWAAAYVNYIHERDPKVPGRSFEGKSGDLTWYRCTTKKVFPQTQVSLEELPTAKVFPQTGIATLHTSPGKPSENAMLSFRSSPYGSTSHALANQNAFNTFYGGKAIFYSSGHRTGFTDDHCMYAYRNTRAHNTLLVDGMGQKIGTEGYGWIPRFYEGEELSYVVGDASNAYGEVTSALWLERARLSGTQFTPEKGWDRNKLEYFRRHIVQLGKTGMFVIYDELKATEPVEFGYQLHTTKGPMRIEEKNSEVKVTGSHDEGVSVARIYCPDDLTVSVTDRFFSPPANWMNKTDSRGEPVRYADHWHFTASTSRCKTTRFLTMIDSYNRREIRPEVIQNGNRFTVGEWEIEWKPSDQENSFLSVRNVNTGAALLYDTNVNKGVTLITDNISGVTVSVELVDQLPEPEI